MKTSKSTSLAFVTALHVLAFYAWPRLLNHPPSPQPSPAGSLFVQLIPFPEYDRVRENPPSAAVQYAAKSVMPKRKVLPESITASPAMSATPAEAVVADQNVQADKSPAAISSGVSITQSALSSILQIDRDARKNARKLLEIAPKSLESQLATAIAKSAGPNSFTTEEKIMADGRRVTKVSGPSGTYCVFEGGPNRADGRDVMQTGVQKKTQSCGSFF